MKKYIKDFLITTLTIYGFFTLIPFIMTVIVVFIFEPTKLNNAVDVFMDIINPLSYIGYRILIVISIIIGLIFSSLNKNIFDIK